MQKIRKPPNVSVIVVNAKGTKYLKNCLDSLLKNICPHMKEIIVVDCLTNGIEEWVAKNYTNKVRLIHFDTDLGPATQHNIGFFRSSSESKYIAFLDNDTKVKTGWLKEIIRIMEIDETLGVVQPKIMKADQSNVIDCAGGFVNKLCNTYPRGQMEIDKGQYNVTCDIFTAKGAAMVVRKDLFIKVGLYDDSFFILFDETDFCWRVWLAGYRVVYAPTSTVYHVGGGTAEPNLNILFHEYKNQIATLLKNHSNVNALTHIPLLIIHLFFTSIFKLFEGDARMIICVIKSISYIIFNLRHIYKKRLFTQSILRKKPYEITKLMPKFLETGRKDNEFLLELSKKLINSLKRISPSYVPV